ncbi:SGNH/GDSL hydrolase family protein [Aquibacillus sp. 3ASR75-11]|uniref:SGNH/GDSL hydrolase family protein n=1 Tax=Terrihalobacillus insolitus TaxID=2950438 RepID=A0A9X3WRQ1_9BACI|nr:SGNH/GDSL hydrolase family protein [Terrihalobacillus insolitus]MDC3413818.1 SGNH/GDSL hydrolase family protein [Terrihalobacillus insolitus]MDC3424535.1 SGNH/GDSL hydrolase family protein [Terrihalobacillus insolitus]
MKGEQPSKLDGNMTIDEMNQEEQYKWYDPRSKPFTLSGFPWMEEDQIYRRLKKNPGIEIPEAVNQLANCTAGGQIRFQTNSTTLSIKVKLADAANMYNMPPTGQCGFDCYIGDFPNHEFYRVTQFDHTEKMYTVTLLERENTDPITITLHFPLYQGVEEVYIGLDDNAQITSAAPYESSKKIIFYGTSITQGGCASRPGLAYTNILSRRFNQEFINLGFSGNGKGEANMAKLISEIFDPACLVLDYEPNCVSTALYKETLPRFIKLYRQVHPIVPILLVSKFPYAAELIDEQVYNDRIDRLEFQRELVDKRKRKGDWAIFFHEGTNLLGDVSNEGTVDGVHPNDLGFMRIADSLTPILKQILTN